MCGIAGYFGSNFLSREEALSCLQSMGKSISHRGPDSSGEWFDGDNRVGLAHRRLSVVDLSDAGSQPMFSRSGRYIISYNGEIYNHNELRLQISLIDKELKWRGHSDTETLLECIEKWGIKSTIEKCHGMFAFAIWDRKEKTLILSRDRIGEKPLYYGFQGDSFLFASEIRALKAHPSFKNEINEQALFTHSELNYIPAPLSIYKDIKKIEPGTILYINQKMEIHKEYYWSINDFTLEAKIDSTEEAISSLSGLINTSVKNQMISDVSTGVFLSGGIDSSLIASVMQSNSGSSIASYSIGFEEDKFDESKYAKDIALHLGTNHTEMFVTAKDALDVIPNLPSVYDEPFSDHSQIPTYLLSKLAKEHVTVALSGDGGDELFGGYTRYKAIKNILNILNFSPSSFQKTLAFALNSIPVSSYNFLSNFFQNQEDLILGDKAYKLANKLKGNFGLDFYKDFISIWGESDNLFYNNKLLPYKFSLQEEFNNRSITDQMMLMDMVTYLPDDIMAKVDRASMAVSLETRVPLLDHKIVEFALQLPTEYKIRNGEQKWILKQVLYNHIPKHLLDRPKMGFGIPIGSWLRGPLKEWGFDLIYSDSIFYKNILNKKEIQKKWKEHQECDRNWEFYLWNILTTLSWLDSHDA